MIYADVTFTIKPGFFQNLKLLLGRHGYSRLTVNVITTGNCPSDSIISLKEFHYDNSPNHGRALRTHRLVLSPEDITSVEEVLSSDKNGSKEHVIIMLLSMAITEMNSESVSYSRYARLDWLISDLIRFYTDIISNR